MFFELEQCVTKLNQVQLFDAATPVWIPSGKSANSLLALKRCQSIQLHTCSQTRTRAYMQEARKGSIACFSICLAKSFTVLSKIDLLAITK